MRISALVVVAACSGAPPAVPQPITPTPPTPAPAVADPLNLDFEVADGVLPKGWKLGGGKDAATTYKATIDGDAHHGAASLKIASIAADGRFLPASNHTDATPYRGKHVRLRGWIKTDNVAGMGAALWLRADGKDHSVHGFDNMGENAVHGTTGWHEVVAESDIDDGADVLVFGVMLIGQGSAWFDALSIETGPLEPPKPLEVSGRVVDAADAPVAGAEVLLVHYAASQHATTDASGSFRFTATKGSWTLTAHHAPSVASQIAITLTKTTTGVEIKLGKSDGATLRIKATGAPIPPDAFALVSAEIDGGDGGVWRVPVASDGRITAVVPRSMRYDVALTEKLIGEATFMGGVAAIEGVLDVRAPAPPPDTVTTFLRDRATALTTPETGHGFDDMAPIGKLVGDAHLVGLGEATHGTREFFQLKHRFLEYLVAEKGFTVFAIEANQPECRAINDYIRDGKGDAKTALRGIYFWTWNTEEVLAMIEWMRAWNQDPKHVQKLEFTGYDMQVAPVAYASVVEFVTNVDPKYAGAALAPLQPIATARGAKLSDADAKAIGTALAALAKQLDAHKADYTKASSANAFTTARHDLTILQQWFRLSTGVTPMTSSTAIRDESMADNIAWLRAQHPASTKMVVWAHNFHVSRTQLAMGSHLSRRFGKDYVVFGFAFGRGSFQAVANDGLRELTLGPAPEHDLSEPFTRTGKPIVVVDLRALPPGPIAAWFAEPHPMRETGAVFIDEAAMSMPVHITKLFDALIVVATTTRARPVQ